MAHADAAVSAGIALKRGSIISEDYNFCLRASVLGLDIYVDTRHPAFHLYEPEQMAGAVDFYKKWYGDTI